MHIVTYVHKRNVGIWIKSYGAYGDVRNVIGNRNIAFWYDFRGLETFSDVQINHILYANKIVSNTHSNFVMSEKNSIKKSKVHFMI